MSSRPDCIYEIHQLWQSGFSRVYSNCYCSSSFEPEIIKSGQSSHKMYSNNIVNFQESTTILNAHMKKVGKLIICTSYISSLSLYWPACQTFFTSVATIHFHSIFALLHIVPSHFDDFILYFQGIFWVFFSSIYIYVCVCVCVCVCVYIQTSKKSPHGLKYWTAR